MRPDDQLLHRDSAGDALYAAPPRGKHGTLLFIRPGQGEVYLPTQAVDALRAALDGTNDTELPNSVTGLGRAAARRSLAKLTNGYVSAPVADEIADDVLEAVLPLAEGLRLFEPGAPGWGHPVDWRVYNAMHQAQLRDEHEVQRLDKELATLRRVIALHITAADHLGARADARDTATALREQLEIEGIDLTTEYAAALANTQESAHG